MIRVYAEADVRLLVEVDTLHGTLSGRATTKLSERASQVFGDGRYQRLVRTSVAHFNNLRKRASHVRRRQHPPGVRLA
jgi:hypothetical protein